MYLSLALIYSSNNLISGGKNLESTQSESFRIYPINRPCNFSRQVAFNLPRGSLELELEFKWKSGSRGCVSKWSLTLPTTHIGKQFASDTSVNATSIIFYKPPEYFWVFYLPPSRSTCTPITKGRRNNLTRLQIYLLSVILGNYSILSFLRIAADGNIS